ncbi:MAG: alkaline phosphatase family protein [Bradyrhizobium sp.]|uniref:alkaline phosphatase family protein n=1 Tax=Bradyrhizobium sp. TaxID=376 RepID=UPI001D1D07D3|nr:alkaline phosphatase family protein [Bradyrhizobium sp.]MBV9559133.1 alkaline phosphatase family protein [Bradyrhizobium sp.]
MRLPISLGLVSSLALLVGGASAVADDYDHDNFRNDTRTPIKHLVVIFQENISYDHYFGTYPKAMNLPGETPFKAKRNTPLNNNLVTPLDVNRGFEPLGELNLLTNNPNANANAPVAPNNSRHNGTDAANPFRLSPSQASTADQGHNDMPEQAAYNNGNMDGFPAWVGTAGGTATNGPLPPPAAAATKGLVMGYYDGNTVTALWNYAQHYAMSDNSFGTQFGPSSPGAINLISGQANGFSHTTNVQDGSGALLHATHEAFGDAAHTSSNITLIGDADPEQDQCSNPTIDQVTMAGRNIGDLLNKANITWGWFEGGFNLKTVNPNGSTGCARFTLPTQPHFPFSSTDYIPHHQPFQYYASTRNPTHAAPSSIAAIGHSNIPNTHTPDPANHQYDTDDFFAALKAGNLPSVTFLKAPAFQDGHGGYSNPIDEQAFIVKVSNTVQQSRFWSETAIVVLYDDSDGWYDHQMPPIVNPSFNPAVDVLNAAGVCKTGLQQGRPTRTVPLNGAFGQPAWGRCGYGTRQPLLVISPFARRNHVDHTLTDQTSVLKFIEDNWLNGERIQPGGSLDTVAGTIEHMFDFDRHVDNDDNKLILDASTGAVVFASHRDDDDDHDHDHH